MKQPQSSGAPCHIKPLEYLFIPICDAAILSPKTTRTSRSCLAVLRASASPEIALLLFNKSGHGDVGPVDDWVIWLWWEVQDDPLHILQL
jgi:hypothetical protein